MTSALSNDFDFVPRPRRSAMAGLALALAALVGLAPSARATDVAASDKSLSPYFALPSKEGVEAFPLEATRSDVHISGVIANVIVKQRYRNRGKSTIEALYVFPGSTRAAVHSMVMTIGSRIIRAKINERDAARKIYEAAKAEGKTASLLEQQRPNVFQMAVANILPGDVVEVAFEYAELLVPTSGEYELVVPGVVGPRYTTATETTAGAHDRFTNVPYLGKGTGVPFDWDVAVHLDAGVPIQSMKVMSHKVDQRVDGSRAEVRLADGERGGDADFVLRYALRGAAVSSGLLLFPGHEPKDEKFFLLMVQPPKALDDTVIPPREYVFIVDVSGSMHGFPIDTAKNLMNDLLSGLRPQDKFNIMTFSGGNQTLSEKSLSATPENVVKGLRFMSAFNGGGGTEIVPALKRALAMPSDPALARVFVPVTDGYVSVEQECFELIRNNLGKANLFSFGIGSNVNRFLIEGMARAGLGEPFIVLDSNMVAKEVGRLQAMIASPALTRVKVDYRGFDVYDVEPVAIPDLFAEKPVVVFGKYRGDAKGTITVSGFTGKGRFEQVVDVTRVTPDEDHEALPILWARHKIAALSDDQQIRNGESQKDAITKLGLRYSLMTQYTSFVAVDERVRADGKIETVNQPLPMPRGVDNTAVGEPAVAMPVTAMSGMGVGGGGVGYGRGVVSPSAPPPPAKMIMRKPLVRESRGASGATTKDEEESLADAPTQMVVAVTSVTGIDIGVARAKVAQLRAALACMSGTGTTEIELVLDAAGKVVAVKPVAGGSLTLGAGCIDALRKVSFGAGGQPGSVRLKVIRM
ncbi:MAG: VWA domain-containing protein [Myxococcales bacterium]|nr:VWA domain-containing protein [Myxococcales bacterium]